ncbi:MAG: 4'-phosphopantetheinyl transferase superfamily protein [Proteobacteria bacterium]|nr:4'-phosphopantetheinyl transferase superfamily protein [Pseudomonadota bacterium]
MRALLAAYLDCPVTTVRIERGEHGKPRLAGVELEFNLSHARDALLLGVSRTIGLGVDLEVARRRTRPAIELARRFFTRAEAQALARVPQARQQDAFLRLWCAKEAVLKAHGRGIGHGLDRFEFVVDDAGAVTPAATNGWQVVPLAPAPAYLGALAHGEPVARLRAFVARG